MSNKFRIIRKNKWSYNTGKYGAIYHPVFCLQYKLGILWITIKKFENPHEPNEIKKQAYDCLNELNKNSIIKYIKGKRIS